MNYLGKKGYTIFKNNLTKEKIKKIKQDLNVKPFTSHGFGNDITYPIYRESERKFYLPRYYGTEEYGSPEIKLSKGLDIELEFKGSLFDYQNNIIDKYIEHVGESGGGLLDVEPGKGKTVMALNIISRLKKKTLVIVHKSFLMDQWIERINFFLPGAKIGRIQGELIDTENKDIVLGMIQSLSNKSYPDELWDEFGLCVFDECHHLGAEMFSNVMIQIVTNYNLGLSGTMTRKDGLTKVFKYFIGPIVHKEKTDITVKVLVKTIAYESDGMFDDVKTDFKGNPLYSCLITKLDDSGRNQMISNVILNEFSKNPKQQMMVLAHTKSILQHLYDLLILKEPSIGYYLGGMKEEKLKESESKRIILATYAMASEGLDIKTLTSLVLATPKSDVCQSVGRILRSKHESPLVIDIIDNNPALMSQYNKRLTYYSSKNYDVKEFKNYMFYDINEYEQIKTKKNKKSRRYDKTELDDTNECLIKMKL
jgi:superfamily II DNA or RNA helicase